MKKINKIDLVNIFLLIITFSLIFFWITRNNFLYGSIIDYKDQHILFPHYLRELFYSTGDLFPDFMANLGAGQNIYYISYYGLYNPLIMISYLFPFISMLNWITMIMILSIISSVILLYFYLRKNNYNYIISLLGAFIFLCSAPLIFHSHRHIMFVNYMPFLILGLYGVDNYINKKSSLLLIISIIMMILTSYFFSVSGLIALFIYGVYKYLKTENKFKIKDLILYKIKLTIPFIIGVLVTCILLLPTLYSLMVGRLESNVSISLVDLFIPSNYLLYDNYNMGLTLISLIGLVFILIKGKFYNKILSVILLLVSFIPIFNYVLNGFMYIDGKSLIPFIPLVIILLAEAGKYIFKKKLLFRHYLLVIYIVCSSFGVCLITNLKDDLIPKAAYLSETSNYDKLLLNLDDEDFYRINNLTMDMSSVNYISNINEYKTSIYSSTFNTDYKEFYYNTLENNMVYRNKFITNNSTNVLSQMFFSEKYIISDKVLNLNYELVSSDRFNYLYKNEDVLPLGYATSNYIYLDDFNSLNSTEKMINILGSVVLDNENTSNELINIDDIELDYEIIESNNLDIKQTENEYLITSENDGYLKLEIDDIKSTDLLFIEFDVNPQKDDIYIEINGTLNKLTDIDWKYYNENETFNYVLEGTDVLEINFKEGIYDISNISIYKYSYSKISNINETVDPFIVDKDKTEGDLISGTIDVTSDSCFTMSIPYDDGFIIKVDNKEVKYEKVNESFIGFNIDEGYHEIEIEYKAPFKDISMYISISGVIIMIIYLFIERKFKK